MRRYEAIGVCAKVAVHKEDSCASVECLAVVASNFAECVAGSVEDAGF